MTYSEVLRIAPFRRLWLGQAISQLGDSLYYIVFMFMVKKITGSNAMVGYVGAAETLPYLLLGPYAGVLADRLDRRRTMLWSDGIAGLLLVGFAIVALVWPHPPVFSIFVVAAGLSTSRVFFTPARSAAIPALVPPQALLAAGALSSTTQSVMPLLSLTLSAAVLSLLYAISPTMFFVSAVAVNALSFFVSAAFISLLPTILPVRSDKAAVSRRDSLDDVRAGFRYIRTQHVLKVVLALSTVMNLMVSPFFVVYVAANDRWFGGRPQLLAEFEMAFFAGMILGSLAVGRTPIKRPGLGFGWGIAVAGGTIAAMAVSPYVWMFVLWNFIAGIAIPFAQIPISAYTQAIIKDEFRGRTSSAFTMLQIGVKPIGLALGGIMVEKLGLAAAFAIMGGGLGFAGLAGLLDPVFRSVTLPDSNKAGLDANSEPEPTHLNCIADPEPVV